jgi:hypothetical protein
MKTSNVGNKLDNDYTLADLIYRLLYYVAYPLSPFPFPVLNIYIYIYINTGKGKGGKQHNIIYIYIYIHTCVFFLFLKKFNLVSFMKDQKQSSYNTRHALKYP